MKTEIVLDKNIKEDKVIIYTSNENEHIKELCSIIQKYNEIKHIIGYINNETYLIEKDTIERFYTENGKLFANAESKKYIIKSKLYQLEDLLHNSSFVRISNCEITNFNKVEKLNIQNGSTICLKYKSGTTTYVSRRYIKKIKQYLGI